MTGDNDKIALSWTVANNSTVDAMGAWSDEVYLSTTPTPNFSSYSSYWNLGDFRPPLNGPLVASGSYTQDKTLTIPGVPAGTGDLLPGCLHRSIRRAAGDQHRYRHGLDAHQPDVAGGEPSRHPSNPLDH